MQYDIINNNYNKFGGKYDMKELTTKDITEYLKNVMELEASIYRQKEAISVGRRELQCLTPKKKYVSRPYKTNLKKPDESKLNLAKKNMKTAQIIAPICIIVGLIVFVAIFRFSVIFALIYFIIGVGYPLLGWRLNKVQYKTECTNYEHELQDYQQKLKENEENYQKKLADYQNELELAEEEYTIQINSNETAQNALKQLENPLTETQRILDELYSQDILYPKYRNMIAVCSIYEYFATERCTELTGSNGAYNLYEAEVRQNRIINQLDRIISQLDSIRANQYALYAELQKTNDVLTGISNEIKELSATMSRVEDYSHITAYCAQVTAQNTQALKYIALING